MIWLLFGMYSVNVLPQASLVSKSLFAKITSVKFLPGVDPCKIIHQKHEKHLNFITKNLNFLKCAWYDLDKILCMFSLPIDLPFYQFQLWTRPKNNLSTYGSTVGTL